MSFFLPHFVKVILLLGFLWLFARRIFFFFFFDGLGSERDVTARTPSFLGKLECLPLFYFILMPRVVISARAIYNIYIFKFRQNQVGANSSIICFMYTTAPLYSLDRFKSLETSSAHSSDWSSFQHSIFRRSVVNFTFWNKGSVFLRFYARTFLQSIRVSRSVWARLFVLELVRFLLVVHWELALLFHGAWRLISIELGGFKEHFFLLQFRSLIFLSRQLLRWLYLYRGEKQGKGVSWDDSSKRLFFHLASHRTSRTFTSQLAIKLRFVSLCLCT